ncbi:MAG: DsbA family oxidoreductase [Alphaproteobacteria bacterium]
MQIDVISDSICPWCYIGKRRLEQALAQRPDIHFEVLWRPFQLNPETPPGGWDRKEYLEAKFGDKEQAKGVYKMVRAAAEEEGLDFALESQKRLPNTVNSHRLNHWAQTAGVQDAVVEGIFKKYFIDGEDIGDPEVLVSVAEEAGMEADVVRKLLEGDADRELVLKEESVARNMGVTGVPCFIIDKKLALVGAQEPDMLLRAIDHAAQQAAAAE